MKLFLLLLPVAIAFPWDFPWNSRTPPPLEESHRSPPPVDEENRRTPPVLDEANRGRTLEPEFNRRTPSEDILRRTHVPPFHRTPPPVDGLNRRTPADFEGNRGRTMEPEFGRRTPPVDGSYRLTTPHPDDFDSKMRTPPFGRTAEPDFSEFVAVEKGGEQLNLLVRRSPPPPEFNHRTPGFLNRRTPGGFWLPYTRDLDKDELNHRTPPVDGFNRRTPPSLVENRGRTLEPVFNRETPSKILGRTPPVPLFHDTPPPA